MNQKITKKNRVIVYVISFIIFAAALGFDQFTKYLAVIYLKDQGPFVLIDGIFQLRYLENTGAAFGLLEGKQYIFVIGAVLICLAFVYIFAKMPLTRYYLPVRACGIFLCAGAVGNLIDRLRLDYVIDFLYFNFIDFPIFNVADCYVVVSCIVFVVIFLFYYKDEDFAFLSRDKKAEI